MEILSSVLELSTVKVHEDRIPLGYSSTMLFPRKRNKNDVREHENVSHSQLVQKCSKRGSPHLLVCWWETRSEDLSADTRLDCVWHHSPRTIWRPVAAPGSSSSSIDCYTLSTPSHSHSGSIIDASTELTLNLLPLVGDAANGTPMNANTDFPSPISIVNPLILP